ncbi:Serine/threonine-protein kinase 24 [Podochytrium sp. JEL0797]|nr:Serine/threonine-protein kinase 24 [Podochytrium sp. JEL0797]
MDLYQPLERIGKNLIPFTNIKKSNGQVVAIKVLDLDTDDEEIADVQKEISVLSHIDADCITRYHGSYLVGTKLWIVMDFAAGGSLRNLITRSQYDFKADIWSLGITIIELATGNPPFAHHDPRKAIFLIPRSRPAQLEGDFSPQIKEFISLCLTEEPDQRPSAEELLKTRFIKSAPAKGFSLIRDLVARHAIWKTSNEAEAESPRETPLEPTEALDDPDNDDDAWLFDTFNSRKTARHLASGSAGGNRASVRLSLRPPSKVVSPSMAGLNLSDERQLEPGDSIEEEGGSLLKVGESSGVADESVNTGWALKHLKLPKIDSINDEYWLAGQVDDSVTIERGSPVSSYPTASIEDAASWKTDKSKINIQTPDSASIRGERHARTSSLSKLSNSDLSELVDHTNNVSPSISVSKLERINDRSGLDAASLDAQKHPKTAFSGAPSEPNSISSSVSSLRPVSMAKDWNSIEKSDATPSLHRQPSTPSTIEPPAPTQQAPIGTHPQPHKAPPPRHGHSSSVSQLTLSVNNPSPFHYVRRRTTSQTSLQSSLPSRRDSLTIPKSASATPSSSSPVSPHTAASAATPPPAPKLSPRVPASGISNPALVHRIQGPDRIIQPVRNSSLHAQQPSADSESVKKPGTVGNIKNVGAPPPPTFRGGGGGMQQDGVGMENRIVTLRNLDFNRMREEGDLRDEILVRMKETVELLDVFESLFLDRL